MVQPDLRTYLPPLESGDHLNRYEFEHRYNATPHLKKAELIEGVVYMPAALRFKSHGQPHGQLITWFGVYASLIPGVALGDAPTVRLNLDNEPQPDAVLMIEECCGGQARISEDDYIEGPPELAAEISASSAAIDLRDKKRAYRRNGIQEYIVWQVFDQTLTWFSLQRGEYVPLPKNKDGLICSRLFPGLWLAVDDLLAGNMTSVLTRLQKGLASPEHQAFVLQLSQGNLSK